MLGHIIAYTKVQVASHKLVQLPVLAIIQCCHVIFIITYCSCECVVPSYCCIVWFRCFQNTCKLHLASAVVVQVLCVAGVVQRLHWMLMSRLRGSAPL